MTTYAPTVGVRFPGNMGIGANLTPALRAELEEEEPDGLLAPEEPVADYTGVTGGEGLLPMDSSAGDAGIGGLGTPSRDGLGNLSIDAGRLGDFALSFSLAPTIATANLVDDAVFGGRGKGAFGFGAKNGNPTLSDLNDASFGDVPSGNRGGTSFGGPGGFGEHDISMDGNAGSMGGIGVAVGDGGASGGYGGPPVGGQDATTSVFGDSPFGNTTASVPDGWGDASGGGDA